MNAISIRYALIGVILGSFLTFALVRVQPIGNVNAMMGMNIDQHFIEQMIPHHEEAIMMSELALEKAVRPEIKKLAQDIISTQTSENTQMIQWYQQWFGTDVSQSQTQMQMHGMRHGGMHMGMMGDETDMEALKNATDFDQEYIKQMIPHHQMAIMMASMLKSGTNRSEMHQLAQNIIESQSIEINQMSTWYSELH